ncbi:MAG: hypothetical protein LBS50_05995 [Prevotellaceae bacterium]|jgi:hypothetical protein|nr:hypothetical protein [Prevotellaceae bacterium]
MAKQIGRREFLKKSVLGIGSAMLASSLRAIGGATEFFSTQNNPPAPDNSNLMALYKQAKEYFYQKQYSTATSHLTQLIENHPNTLFLYDGLAKVYGAEQNLKTAAELFRQGVAANSQNAFFLHHYGLILRNLCLGNASAAQQFSNENKISNLYEFAAEKIIEANALNPKECFLLDLKDFLRLMEKYNENPRSSSTISLSENIISQIETLTTSVSTKYATTRTSRKPNIPQENSNINVNQNNGNGNGQGRGRNRRNLHSNHERQERENSEKKAQKRVHYSYLANNAQNNNVQKVEKWGMQILTDDIKDTNSVGFLRKYYKKRNQNDRIIALNRYFYNSNNNIYSALALAASLAKYSNNTPALNEAKTLLNSVVQYLNDLTNVGKGAYYNSLAAIKAKENNKTAARTALLEGIETQKGVGGVAYSLMEHYAKTFPDNQKSKAINIQKALCGKQYNVEDRIAPYLEKYRDYISKNQRSVMEQIKALSALAKLQKKYNNADYNATKSEISALKQSLN